MFDDAMKREPLTAAAARSVVVDICQLTVNGPATSIIVCERRLSAQYSLLEMLRPLRTLSEIICVRDGFALMDAYSARAVDVVLIGIDRSSHVGLEAIGLQRAMHPHSVIIAVGAATDVDLLAAAIVDGARGLLIWDPEQPRADGPHNW